MCERERERERELANAPYRPYFSHFTMRKKESNRKTQIEKILKFSFINKETKHLTYSLSLKVVRGLVICKLINERHAQI